MMVAQLQRMQFEWLMVAQQQCMQFWWLLLVEIQCAQVEQNETKSQSPLTLIGKGRVYGIYIYMYDMFLQKPVAHPLSCSPQ